MSEDKTDEPDNVGGTIKTTLTPAPGGRPIPKALHDLRNQIGLSKGAIQHTVTSSAYTSAEMFSPDQAPMIKAYQQAIAEADKGDVFLLSSGKITPKSLGIQTDLESDITQIYAGFEYSERETRESRQHDKELKGMDGEASVIGNVFKRFGVPGALAIAILAVVVWAAAHLTAAPCKSVSVVWGMVEYTKGGSCATDDTSNMATDATIAAPDLTPTETQETPDEQESAEKNELDEPEIIAVDHLDRIYISGLLEDVWDNIAAENEWLENENFDRDYAGNWMRIKGPAKIMGTPENPAVSIDFEASDGFVKIFFRPEDAGQLAPISDGAVITVDGRIAKRFLNMAIVLNEGEIVSYH